MPNTGTPRSKTAGSSCGAPSAYTLAGPPDSTMAFGSLALISSTVAVCGMTSEYTRASRTRRAISCAYCAPKSTTRTGRGEDDDCDSTVLSLVALNGPAVAAAGDTLCGDEETAYCRSAGRSRPGDPALPFGARRPGPGARRIPQ